MMRNALVTVCTVLPLVLLCTPGHALPPCSEGRTLSGKCVNVQLSQNLRKRVTVYTQMKISKTAPIFLPSKDRDYLLPRDVLEQFIPVFF